MRAIKCDLPYADKIEIHTFADLHIGDAQCDYKGILERLEYIKNTPTVIKEKGGCEMPVLNNPRWEDYAQARAAGFTQRVAYRKAYPRSEKWKDATVDNKAYVLEKRGEVKARYEELKEAAANAAGGAVMTRNEKRELLAAMARNMKLPAADRQRAIDLDNKMEDEYTSNVKLSGNVNNPLAGLTTDELKKLVSDD